ncbi:MAG: Hpt domain-containing protein [Rickettsiales bacterium]|nr:Hpt domain-containing protein [Rickettsiales bacterium]
MSLVNHDDYNTLKEVMGDQFEMLVLKFCEMAKNLLGDIKQAVADGDAEALKRSAHPLKSSSAQLGAMKMSEIAKKLEMMGAEGSVEGADALISEFDEIMEESLEILKTNI